MLSEEKLMKAYSSQSPEPLPNYKYISLAGLRAVAEAAVKDAVGGQGVRYTNDGALAECPCCGSLDVGGAHDTVHCYKCGLSMKHPPPLQNAADAWNRRTRPQASAAVPEELVEAIQTGIRVLNSDPGPMTREAVANSLRAMLAALKPEVKS